MLELYFLQSCSIHSCRYHPGQIYLQLPVLNIWQHVKHARRVNESHARAPNNALSVVQRDAPNYLLFATHLLPINISANVIYYHARFQAIVSLIAWILRLVFIRCGNTRPRACRFLSFFMFTQTTSTVSWSAPWNFWLFLDSTFRKQDTISGFRHLFFQIR